MSGQERRTAVNDGRGGQPASAGGRDRKPEGPRRVRHGIKLRSRDGEIERTPLSDPLLRHLEETIPVEESSEGLRYARLGQIASLEVESGAVEAAVQDVAAQPYRTRIIVPVFTGPQWERVIEAMAAEAMYLVKLMADELPEGLDGLLADQDLSLVPAAPDLRFECSCPGGGACRHAAALGYVFAEALTTTPLQILRLRGMPSESVLDRLRQARLLHTRGVAAAHVDPMIPETQVVAPPLESCLEEFWRSSARSAPSSTPPRHVAHALLRRLGPSPLEGKFPLVGLLASIYDSVAEYAVHLRDRVDHLEDAPDAADEGS